MLNRQILVPLSVLAAAGAVAVGSGATFDSSSVNTISSVTAGTLTQSNSKANAAVFDLKDMKPGDTLNGSLTITNTGSLAADFSLTELNAVNQFGTTSGGASYLKLVVTNTTTGTQVYSGDFQALGKKTLGTVDPGKANAYTFTVTLDQTAPNSEQGKTASASFQWDSVQQAGTTYNR